MTNLKKYAQISTSTAILENTVPNDFANPIARLYHNSMSFVKWLRMSLFSHWNSEGFLNRPLRIIDSTGNGIVIQIFNLTPFRNSPANAINTNNPTSPRISHLLFLSHPPAVFFGVIPIVVDAVYTGISLAKLFYMFLVRRIHIFLEYLKRIPHAFDTSPSIIMKSNNIFRVASNFDTRECLSKLSIIPIVVNFFERHNFINETPHYAWKNNVATCSKLITA